MHILGLDPGLSRTGYACVQANWEGVSGPGSAEGVRLVEAGFLKLSKGLPISARLVELESDLEALFERTSPAAVCVESLFIHGAHPRTAVLMAHARGVILLVAGRRRVRLLELAPAAVKKSMAGNGQASKPQMQQAVMTRLALPSLPTPSDVADAIAIAVCGSRRLGVVPGIGAAGAASGHSRRRSGVRLSAREVGRLACEAP